MMLTFPALLSAVTSWAAIADPISPLAAWGGGLYGRACGPSGRSPHPHGPHPYRRPGTGGAEPPPPPPASNVNGSTVTTYLGNDGSYGIRTTSTCVDSGAVCVAFTDCLFTSAVHAVKSTHSASIPNRPIVVALPGAGC